MIVTDATNELLEEFYGERPKQSLKSVVAVMDGKPLGVSGFRYENETMAWFSDMSDELRNHPRFKRIMVEAYTKLFSIKPNVPVYSFCDPAIKGSEKLLEHLGFRYLKDNIWVL